MPSSSPDIPDETTTSTEPPAYLKPYLTQAAQRASALGNIPMEYFPNQTFLPSNQWQDMGAMMSLMYGTSPQVANQIGNAQTAQQFMLSAPDITQNQTVQDMMDMTARRTGEQFQRYILPGVKDQAQSMGQFGGSEDYEQRDLAAGEAMRAIADQNAQIASQAYSEGLAQQRAGMAVVPQTMGLGYFPGQAYSGFGDYMTRDPALALQEQMSRFDFAQQEPWNRLQNEVAMLTGMPGSTTTATNPAAYGGADPMTSMLGLGSLGMGAYNSGLFGGLGALGAYGASSAGPLTMMSAAGSTLDLGLPMLAAAGKSDRRLKRDIEPLARDSRGRQWYRFEYKHPERDGYGPRLGVMAQEIQETDPRAVFEMPDGYLAVDYAQLWLTH